MIPDVVLSLMLEKLQLDDNQRNVLVHCLFVAVCSYLVQPWQGPDDVCLFEVADDFYHCALARLLLLLFLSDVCKCPIC